MTIWFWWKTGMDPLVKFAGDIILINNALNEVALFLSHWSVEI